MQNFRNIKVRPVLGMLATAFLTATLSPAVEPGGDIFVLTSTNSATNNVVVFKLNSTPSPTLSLVGMLPTGGAGGAGGNAGAVQFQNSFGAVVNYGSNNVTQLVRYGNYIQVARNIELASGCTNPVSVALAGNNLFVAGANCAESHAWPAGNVDGPVVALPDSSAAQIAVGQSWAAVTLKSGNGSVLQLPLTASGGLAGTSSLIALSLGTGATPLGEAFWGDILGFDPAHAQDSFALMNKGGTVIPVAGPTPPYPTNAPCWLAKGPGNVWYSGNSPGTAISIFFSDSQGGVFYKSIPLPGVPTDITVSSDNNWLAVIYTAAADGLARVAVFAIDAYGDLSLTATSSPVGSVGTFNGVAISQ